MAGTRRDTSEGMVFCSAKLPERSHAQSRHRDNLVTDEVCAFMCSWVSADLQHDDITVVVEKA